MVTVLELLPLLEALVGVTFLIVLWAGGYQVLQGRIGTRPQEGAVSIDHAGGRGFRNSARLARWWVGSCQCLYLSRVTLCRRHERR